MWLLQQIESHTPYSHRQPRKKPRHASAENEDDDDRRPPAGFGRRSAPRFGEVVEVSDVVIGVQGVALPVAPQVRQCSNLWPVS